MRHERWIRIGVLTRRLLNVSPDRCCYDGLLGKESRDTELLTRDFLLIRFDYSLEFVTSLLLGL